MTDKINFQGKIGFSQGDLSVTFDKANVSIVAEKIYNEYENIIGDSIHVPKGYRYSSKIQLILLNSDSNNYANLNKLLAMISLLSAGNPISLSLYKQDKTTVSTSINFHVVFGDIKYTDYLSNNAKIGIMFDFSLETIFIVSSTNLIHGWQG